MGRTIITTPSASIIATPSTCRSPLLQKRVERTPGATLEVAVPLPADLNSPGGDLVRAAYRSAAASRGVPGEFFDSWVKEHAPTGYSLRDASGKELTIPDAMKPDAFDEKNH